MRWHASPMSADLLSIQVGRGGRCLVYTPPPLPPAF